MHGLKYTAAASLARHLPLSYTTYMAKTFQDVLPYEVREALLGFIRKGAPIKTAAGMARVQMTWLNRFLKMGEDITTYETDLESLTPEENQIATFYLDFQRAESDIEYRILGHWATMAEEDWKAGQAFLKARFGETWNAPEKLEIKHSGEQQALDLSLLTADELETFQILLEKATNTHRAPMLPEPSGPGPRLLTEDPVKVLPFEHPTPVPTASQASAGQGGAARPHTIPPVGRN